MDTSNPTNGTINFSKGSNNSGGNWRTELSSDSRHKIVNKIMDTLQRHMPPTGPDGMTELKKIALRFEEKIYTAAVDQQDYLRKISLKMLSLRNHVSNPTVQVSSSANNQRPPDPGLGIPSQMRNTPQSPALGNLPQQQQQTLLQQNLQSAMSGGGIQSTSGLTSTLSSMTSLSQSTSGQVFGTQSAMTNSTGQVLSQNPLLARQLQSRQQQHPQQVAQHHQQTQAQHQLFYQQPLQHPQQQALKEKLQQQSQLAPSILQQQQSTVMQQSQLQTSQQSLLQSAQTPTLQSTQQSLLRQSQPSLQPAQQSALQQTSQPFLQQQHQQSVLRQQQSVLQQQPSMLQQQQPSMFNVPNMQQQQQQQQQQQLQQIIQSKSSQYQQAQQPSPSLLQAQSQQLQQQPQQQQLLSQLQHQPQQLQQQQSLFPQSNTVQQDLQQRLHTSGGLLQQQQQQSSVEQQKQLLQAHNQRLSDASTTSMEPSGQGGQSTTELQEKIYQKLQNMKDKYSADLQEVIARLHAKCSQPMQAADQLDKLKNYKLKVQRMLQYFTVAKNSIPPGCPEDKIDAVERQIQFVLNAFKPGKPTMQQQQGHPQLISQPGSQVHSMQQQSQPPMLQIQQQEKHVNQLQQINPQASVTSMQPNNVTPIQHGSMPQVQQSGVQTTMQNIRTAMQHGASLNTTQGSGISALQQSLLQHSNSNINGPQQNNSAFQQNSMSSLQQNGNNPLQQNDLNANALQHHHQGMKQQEMLQAQQFKQRQMQMQMQMQQQQHHQQFQQQHPQNQQQLQQLQQQHPQNQQQLQQLQQQQKQQQAAQMQAQQMPHFQQMNELNSESRSKQAANKQAPMHQHPTLGQRSVYQQQQQQQQFKTVSTLPVSSPQVLPAASPQFSQQSSPQLDQQSLVASSLPVPKLGTPVQPATSPFTAAPSPSTLPAPSPVIEDAEKQSSAISSISNAGSGQAIQQTANALSHSHSIAIATPGISASPLLADFSSSPAQNIVNQDGHQNMSAGILMEDKSSTKEPPFKRLVKVMNSISPKAFASAVNDIGSVVSLNDRMAGSAPCNGSRGAVGEDLVAMTKCRLQARNLMSQDGSATTKRMSRCISSMPLSTVSSGGSVTNSLQQNNNQDSPEMESTATSRIKRPRVEMSHVLKDELREINQQLIDTVAKVSEDDNDSAAAAAEGRDGVVVKCSYTATALSPNMKSRYRSSLMTPISPLRLLVPASYPNCSPILLDKVPIESCKEHEDLSSRVKAKFHAAVRTLPQPMSLKELAKTWDNCAWSIVAEYAHQSGGGSFSSRFGTWENCASA